MRQYFEIIFDVVKKQESVITNCMICMKAFAHIYEIICRTISRFLYQIEKLCNILGGINIDHLKKQAYTGYKKLISLLMTLQRLLNKNVISQSAKLSFFSHRQLVCHISTTHISFVIPSLLPIGREKGYRIYQLCRTRFIGHLIGVILFLRSAAHITNRILFRGAAREF